MSGKEKIRVKVEIYGKSYKLLGSADTPVAYIHQVARMVDEQMLKIGKLQPSLDIPRVAVLSAVNLANDYLSLKNRWDEELMVREQQIKQLELDKQELEQQLAEVSTIQAELESKVSSQELESQRLREEIENLKLVCEQSKQESAASDERATEFRKLEEEYRKLQTEFNDWLQLVEQEK